MRAQVLVFAGDHLLILETVSSPEKTTCSNEREKRNFERNCGTLGR